MRIRLQSTTGWKRNDRINTLTFGTRGSALALQQTHSVIQDLKSRFPSLNCRVVELQTPGDRWQQRPIWSLGDKGVFVRPLEKALVNGQIDVAVHSLKDVPADEEIPGLTLLAFPIREDPRDVLISKYGATLDNLPERPKIATSSLRRRMQLRTMRPDMISVDMRGNVDTRLRKLESGSFDALVLAAAGLKRLGLEDRITEYFAVDRLIPDAGQGILAVQTRLDDEVTAIVRALDDFDTRSCAMAERSTVQALGADCRSPVGVHAFISEESIRIRAIASVDGNSPPCSDQVRGDIASAASLGRALGETLKADLERQSL